MCDPPVATAWQAEAQAQLRALEGANRSGSMNLPRLINPLGRVVPFLGGSEKAPVLLQPLKFACFSAFQHADLFNRGRDLQRGDPPGAYLYRAILRGQQFSAQGYLGGNGQPTAKTTSTPTCWASTHPQPSSTPPENLEPQF